MLVSCTPETDFQSDFSILYLNANAKYVYTDLLLCGTLNNFSFLNLKHAYRDIFSFNTQPNFE